MARLDCDSHVSKKYLWSQVIRDSNVKTSLTETKSMAVQKRACYAKSVTKYYTGTSE